MDPIRADARRGVGIPAQRQAENGETDIIIR
jgi:hypothetical protein